MDYSRFSYGNFVREEAYNASSQICYAFRRGTDERNGIVLSLGNMVSGYPFMLDGVRFHNSECAYIAGAFSYDMERHLSLQERLAECTNGYMAKKSIRKPHEALIRASIKRELDAMRLGEWANVGVFRGKNVMGKILMVCRDALRNGSEPQIDYALLREKRINLLGHLLTFEVVQAA